MSTSSSAMFKLGALAVVVAALVMAVLPYRIVWHNRAELTSFNGRDAYVLGRNSPEVLLYIPTDPETIRLTVNEEDPRIEWKSERQFVDIFEGQ